MDHDLLEHRPVELNTGVDHLNSDHRPIEGGTEAEQRTDWYTRIQVCLAR